MKKDKSLIGKIAIGVAIFVVICYLIVLILDLIDIFQK